ncbi:MAG: ABC transporter substrate-binding protein [Paracoccaceae bacterium]|nr:MAG: ABC transporter substrate-binding protein [Paracoccaceae bacterium]
MPRSRLKSILIPLLLAAAAAAPLPLRAQPVMKLATATINDVQHEWMKVFAEELAARVGDRVKAEIYPASQLGAIPRMVEGVLLGTIEAFTTPTSFMTNVDPRFQAFDVPGLFRSPEDVHAVIHDPEFRDHMETMFLDKGLRIIGAIYNSPTVVFTLKPVARLDDLAGLKIRTFASPMQIEPMKLLGATPLPLALSEVVPALQSGALDGMLVGMPILTAFKYYDIGRHVLDLRFAEIVSVTVVNEGWFQAQPAELREAIRAAGRAAEQRVYPWGVANVERTYRIWTEHGGVITELSEADQARMQKAFAELAERLVSADPAVVAEYRRIRALLAQRRGG